MRCSIGQMSGRIKFPLPWNGYFKIPSLVFLAPESPWWLVRKNRIDEPVSSAKRLTTKGVDANFDAHNAVSNMAQTLSLETRIYSTSKYTDLFRGIDLGRTEIACCTWLIRTFCGSAVLGYGIYSFESSDMSTTHLFDMDIAKQALRIVGTLILWAASPWFGWRTLFIQGISLCDNYQFVSLALSTNSAANWAIDALLQVALLQVAQLIYEIAIAPPTYIIVPEISWSQAETPTMLLSYHWTKRSNCLQTQSQGLGFGIEPETGANAANLNGNQIQCRDTIEELVRQYGVNHTTFMLQVDFRIVPAICVVFAGTPQTSEYCKCQSLWNVEGT